ncbi:MAG: PD40 domain-containing protein [Acidobacteria bacterium]|nr:PD40 domain-containing protein [Acidobacteriota bacterium]
MDRNTRRTGPGTDGKPIPFVRSPFDETQGQFSPDGRYVAYTSNESKRADVYIQPFPTTGRRWQVSSGGGSQPRWRRDGKELFYVAPGGVLMAVPIVSSGVGLEVGAPISLFEHRVLAADNPIDNVYSYDVTADGQRFLLAVPKPGSEVPPITVLVNWAAGLKRDN